MRWKNPQKFLNEYGFPEVSNYRAWKSIQKLVKLEGEDKMEKENNEFVGEQPQFKGDGVAVWVNKDKNGKNYLSIKLLGSIRVNAFKNEPKEVTV